jgi:FkbM family methyltransferase
MVAVDCRGSKFLIFDKPDVISDGLRANVGHDAFLEYYSIILVGDAKDGVILDIGSNIGTYVVPLAKEFPGIEFYSFEPQRIVFYQLCSNIILNGLENVHATNKGLSDTPAEIEVITPDYMVEKNVGAFSLDAGVHKNNNVCSSQGRSEKIQIDRLDDYGFKDVRLIKIDVEGLEMSVIKGGLETIKANDYPPIIFETWSIMDWYKERRKELLEYVESLGYHITTIGDNCIAQHTSRKVIEWANK